MLKDVLEKALSSILVAAIIGMGGLMYKEYQTYQELRDLIEVKKELEKAFIEEKETRIKNDKAILKYLSNFKESYRKDSINNKWSYDWCIYWVKNQ